ncbi:MAG: GIN domain-containing protein [Sphingomonas sp.]|uniref:GIN domain-containing protein n=1 Tax=Sphingomonas sp. TaxID=28214 RepID=UPI003F80FADE
MLRRSLVLALIALAAPAHAADRSYVVTNFDRVRVDGPFEVRVEVGGPGGAAASATGDDRMLDDLDVSVQGATLIVRKGSQGWGERGPASGAPPAVTLRTPTVRGANVVGGGRLTLAGKVRTTRLDIQVTGAGAVEVGGIDADDVVVTVIGNGNVALAGRTARARLSTNGGGSIAAAPLDAGDVLVMMEGAGETRASARYTADITNRGLGLVAIGGNPRCTIRGQATGPVQCGGGGQP